ncbi:PhnP protein [Enterococcus sp. JM4C]|uniref:MBL fold metallo-hydrolase n=1 Tax=Candidatus Enterococcus huntleyi TaxID=1857217 RepID=UPI00137A8D47|nr:MBL fold metallo-hydrolase [Enterococcus sp. JM4C]KAF1299462.1 PhnP protein [Enterococcus sp. JM4C]
MKLHYLGTAAAERVPGIFCNCRVCNIARETGGRELRTQTQTLVDDGDLLIDFPGDSYLHLREYQLNFNDIEHLLITHWHSDHLYAEDLAFRMEAYGNNLEKKLTVYGSKVVHEFFNRAFELEGMTDPARIEFKELLPFEKYTIGQYTVHTLPAVHGRKEGDCLIYLIERDGKRLFYTHDTGFPTDEVLDYLEENHLTLDAISLDCTGQGLDYVGGIHMNVGENLRLIEELKKRALCEEKTINIVSHFSHNGGLTYKEMKELADKHELITAYDGMVIDI